MTASFDRLKINPRPVLKLEELSLHRGGQTIFDRLNLDLRAGSCHLLEGPNGAGKTSLFRTILGLLRPTSGRLELFGKADYSEIHRVAYLPQLQEAEALFPITVEEVVNTGLVRRAWGGWGSSKRSKVLAVLAKLELSGLAKKSFSVLSGGQKRRVLFARALVSQPELLLLDEPQVNMDKDSLSLFLEILAELKGQTTLLITTHEPDLLRDLADFRWWLQGSLYPHEEKVLPYV